MPLLLVAVGNPLLDISAIVDASLLGKYTLKANDAILADEKHTQLYTDILAYKPTFIAGGAAQNSMRGAQWLLPKNSTLFIGNQSLNQFIKGCVGNDDTAQILKQSAESDGLHTEYLVDDVKPTGRCAVLITNHDRCLVTDLQAANEYKITHLESIWPKVIEASFFYSSGKHSLINCRRAGYFLTVSPQSALKLANYACEQNKCFALNLSAPFIPQFFGAAVDELMPFVDILFGNESESTAWADAHGYKGDTVEIAKIISALPKENGKRDRIVCFTQGCDATVMVVGGVVTMFEVSVIAKEDIIDTNGAGYVFITPSNYSDAFVGGFMSQYVQGKELKQCVECGHYVAGVVVKREGPSYPSTAHEFKC